MTVSIPQEVARDERLRPLLTSIRDISDTDYHEGAYASYIGHSKALMMRHQSVARVAWRMANEPTVSTPALVMGKLVHDSIEHYTPGQELTLPQGFAISPYSDYRAKEARTWRDDQIAAGNAVIKAEDWEQTRAMITALVSNPTVANLLNMPHVREGSIVTQLDGLDVKVRPDMLCIAPDGSRLVCVDWKTCEDASPEVWPRDAHYRGYHLQAYMYKRVLEQVSGIPTDFIFCAVEKSAPYQVAIYAASDAWISAGEDLWYGTLLPKWELYMEGEYESLYDPGSPIILLDPPAYAAG